MQEKCRKHARTLEVHSSLHVQCIPQCIGRCFFSQEKNSGRGPFSAFYILKCRNNGFWQTVALCGSGSIISAFHSVYCRQDGNFYCPECCRTVAGIVANFLQIGLRFSCILFQHEFPEIPFLCILIFGVHFFSSIFPFLIQHFLLFSRKRQQPDHTNIV